MSLKNYNNINMKVEREGIIDFVTMYKNIKEITKILKNKQIIRMKYTIEIEYR